METIGGGIILDPSAKKHAANESILNTLHIKEKGNADEVVGDFIAGNKENSTKISDVSAYIGSSEDEVIKTLDKLQKEGTIIELNGVYYHYNTIEIFKKDILEILNKYHNAFPLKSGIGKEELRSKSLLSFKSKDFELLLKIMEDNGLIKSLNSIISAFGFEIIYDKKRSGIKAEIEDLLKAGKFTPPTISEITRGKKECIEVLESLVGNSIVKLDDQTVICTEYYQKAIEMVVDFINKNHEITLAEFRDITGSSRKYSMIILEDFDKKKITKRVENKRVLYDNS